MSFCEFVHKSMTGVAAKRIRGTTCFTLIELLSVMGIIMILAAIVMAGSVYASRKSALAGTRSVMERFEMALEAHRLDRGFYPQSGSDAAVNLKDESGGLFVDSASTTKRHFTNSQTSVWYLESYPLTPDASGDIYVKDAWGQPLRYRCPGTNNPESFDLWSFGRDRKSSTAEEKSDDVTNWRRD